MSAASLLRVCEYGMEVDLPKLICFLSGVLAEMSMYRLCKEP